VKGSSSIPAMACSHPEEAAFRSFPQKSLGLHGEAEKALQKLI